MFTMLLLGAAPAVLASASVSSEAAFDAGEGIDRIIITGRQSPSLTADTAEDARRRAEAISGAASVIDAATLQTQRTQTLADALRLAPGVFASPRFGDEDLRLSVRGSGIVRTGHGKGVLLIRDGVVINQPDGNFDAPVFDFASASHITLLRGAAALGAGATTLGGVIEVNSRTGLTHPGARIEASAGSFETLRGAAQIGGSSGQLDGFAAVSAGRSDGYRANAETRSLRLTANAGFRFSDTLETRLYAAYVESDGLWPGTLTRAQFEADPRQAAAVSLARRQATDIEQTFLSSRTVWAPGAHQLTAALGWNDRFKYHPTPGGILEEASQTWSAALTWSWAEANSPVSFSAGLRYADMDQDAVTFAYAGGVNSPQSADKGAVSSNRARTASNSEAWVRAGFDATDDLKLTASLAALRTERDDRRAAGDPSPNPAFSRTYEAVMPGVGLIWRAGETWSVFASLARSAEAPSFFDLGGNAPLQPDRIPRLRLQTADTLEAGVRGQAGPARFDVTVYHGRVKGELLRLDAAGALNPPIVNADRTLRTGLEAAGEYEVSEALFGAGPGLTLAGKYDWSWFRFDNDPVYGSNRVAGVPEHAAYGEARFSFGEHVTVSPNLTWRGRTSADLANTVSADASVLFGLGAAFERGPVRFWIDGRNLTDERWVSATNVVNQAGANSGLFFPGDGRSVYAGIALSR